MTTTRHTKTIVAAIVTGALAIAAPAGASVLEPVTAAYNSSPGQAQTVNATVQQPSDQGGGSSQFIALRRDGSKAEPFVASVAGTPVAHSGDGFDVSDAALGGVLVAVVMLLGSGAIRQATQPEARGRRLTGGLAHSGGRVSHPCPSRRRLGRNRPGAHGSGPVLVRAQFCGLRDSKRGRPSSGRTSQPAFEPTKLW